jgi:outer membrane protein OmpA-like peptidoglycan-associated protein
MLALAILFTACSGSHTSESASPAPATVAATETPAVTTSESPSPVPSESASASSAAASPAASGVVAGTSAAPGATQTPTPEPTPTPYANLLSPKNGTIVRSYPTSLDDNPENFTEGEGFKTGATPPYVVVFEMPGVATITSFEIWLPAAEPSATPGKVTIEGSTTSADSGYSPITTLTSTTTLPYPATVPVANAQARWLRVTIDAPTTEPIHGIYAFGSLAPRPPNAPSFAGDFVQVREPYATPDGHFDPSPPPSSNPWYVGIVQPTGGIGGAYCRDNQPGDGLAGPFTGGRTWHTKDPDEPLYVNDEGTMIVGQSMYLIRTTDKPAFCAPTDGGGKGPHRVLVLHPQGLITRYPVGDDAKDVPGTSFTQLSAGLVDAAILNGYQTVMLDGVCKPDEWMSPAQLNDLIAWTQAGHKLLMYTADMCGNGSDFTWLPYPFTSSNPGARGAASQHLIEVENDALGSLEKTDKDHYFDPAPWAANVNNQIGDADTVTSHDPHWCGHLFGTNANNVNGFMQMYSVLGHGLIIYDGFDHDDDGNPVYQRMRRLELTVPVDEPLPCTQNVALSFLIEPNRDVKFTPGKPLTVSAPMQLLANQGWKGHVTITTSGDFAGVVSPNSFDIAGGLQDLKVSVRVPASAKPGTYAVIVNGVGNDGTKSQATVNLIATTPLVKQLQVQRRIRLYGIHFDVDSAHIQPRSEPVIADVAKIMRSEPSWRFRVEGHTDSDGGLAHNQVLSQHRAESVVADLVKRYHIARSRLVPVGYGYSRPVASNATAAGKALNRRVELFRL